MMFLMSQDRPSSRDGTSKLMNHVLMQPSQLQYNNNNNLIINKNNFLAIDASNNNNSNLLNNNKPNSSIMMSTTSASVPSPITSSINYITTTTITQQSANGDDQNEVNGNVLLANEQMEPSDNEQTPDDGDRKTSNQDEELTPLHWLHDKNLLKGINLSCPKVQQSTSADANQRNGTGGRSSVTSTSANSDSVSVDDSGVSEDNTSSVNSSVEQNGNYTSPSSPINYTTTDNNSSNLLINSLSSVKSLGKNSHSISNNNPATVTSTTMDITSKSSAASLSNNITLDHYQSSNLNSEESINRIIKAPQPQTPHQHFHKKYLRETLKQQDEEKKYLEPSHQQMSSYIVAKNQHETRYIYADDREFIANFNNNNNNNNNNTITSSYDKNHEYDLSHKAIDYATPKANSSYSSGASSSSSSSPSPKQKQQYPNNIPYDPLVHTASKPPYSFSSLIFMAIEDSLQKALPVKEIYAWIIQHFPYFKTAPTGWKNSVRHNLSLNKCFQKVEKAANLGKGSLWMVEPQYRPNLIQALTRSPFHPCSTWEKHNKSLTKAPGESPEAKSNGSARLPNPEHFPFLSRRLAAAMESYDEEGQSRASTPSTNYEMPHNYSNTFNADSSTNGMIIYQNNNNSIIINGNLQNSELLGREMNAETIDDVNAATAMLALKHGPKIFTEGIPFAHPPVITKSPSEDHTYSAFTGGKNGTDNNSNGTSSDAAYESSEESNVVYHFSQPMNEQELEEQRRQAEGVDALLNLAGYNTNTTLLLKRPASTESHQQQQQQQPYDRKQSYFYTTEISPASQQYHHDDDDDDYYMDGEPPSKKPNKSRILRNKLKKKSWLR